ncbi:MAG: hypothetical protein ACI845_004291 [Gammaproteobacteria bacterium]|jgi:hypothetical protein
MRSKFYRYYFLWLFVCLPLSVSAGPYWEVAPAFIALDTPARSSRPLLVDFRIGDVFAGHHFEAAVMLGLTDHEVNQLTVEIPLVISVFYKYAPPIESSIKLHLIGGFSHVEVDSDYPGIDKSTDKFDGFSYGFGFEEAFRKYPKTKISADIIRLYHGEDIRINVVSLGVHYDF